MLLVVVLLVVLRFRLGLVVTSTVVSIVSIGVLLEIVSPSGCVSSWLTSSTFFRVVLRVVFFVVLRVRLGLVATSTEPSIVSEDALLELPSPSA